MGLARLAKWQWEGYSLYHQSWANLLIHIVLVPLFLAGNILLLAGIARLSWPVSIAGLIVMAVSFAAQGLGHGRESNPSVPFTGFGNALARIFLEQWIAFPRFVITGGWMRAFRSAPL
jgi:uncharacterized membrane protein YGL010W